MNEKEIVQSEELLHRLLNEAIARKASDLHLSAGYPPYFRQQGRLAPAEEWPILDAVTIAGVGQVLAARTHVKLPPKVGSLDGGLSAENGTRFRFNIFRRSGALSVAFRRLEERIRSLPELGLPTDLYQLANYSNGLVLVAGPTGSGKSTTLATLIDRINQTRTGHIITIEDPIEYLHKSNRSLVDQREVGQDTESFNEALVASMRQDPDVILVGEMRDLETIEAAITAAETGHVVFGTLHTNSAQGTINRIIDAFPGNLQDQIRTQLSTSIIGVLAQTLLPRIGGGRVAAYETLLVTPAITNLIRENKTFRINSAIQTGAKFGMQLMDDALFDLWKKEICIVEDILTKAHRPDDLAKRIVAAQQGLEAPRTGLEE